ncbi:hypothetical protein Tco_0699953 [Tanacetum coccineum]
MLKNQTLTPPVLNSRNMTTFCHSLKDNWHPLKDPTLNKKVLEVHEAYTGISNNITELLSLAKTFDFSCLKSLVETMKADLDAKIDHLATWAKYSTPMAWNVGSRLIKIEHTQALMKADLSSLKSDTLEIKSMMREIYQAFKGQSSTPSSSMPQTTLAITEGPANVGGNVSQANTDTKEPPSHTKGGITSQPESSQVPQREGKGITTDEQLESTTKKLVPALKVVRDNPDEPIRVPYMINGKMHYLTNDEINAHIEKEDKIKKAAEEANIAKAGEKFKKAYDAKHQVLKIEHSQKIKRLMELNKKIDEQYMWTISNRLKPEPITYVRIHPNSKPAVLTVFKNNDKRNFQAHGPFKFFDFKVTEYEILKKIPEELGIQSALPAPIPEQAPSQSLGRKRKHIELEPEIKVPRLECNRSLPEGIPFVNNMVIEELGYGIFFTNVFGDQAFQRWNDIHKVGVDSLVLYLVMASMIKTLENARFGLTLKKLIAEHPDQEKL